MTLNDLEPSKQSFTIFAISCCDAHFKNELRRNTENKDNHFSTKRSF